MYVGTPNFGIDGPISLLGSFRIGVRSCYDEGKRTAETLTMDYHRGANVEVSNLVTEPWLFPRVGIFTQNY